MLRKVNRADTINATKAPLEYVLIKRKYATASVNNDIKNKKTLSLFDLLEETSSIHNSGIKEARNAPA
jgi:hypothetical protein